MSGVRVHQRAGVASLIGPRERNEDFFLLSDLSTERGPVLARLAVADGMGGHEAGEVASRAAVESAARAIGDAFDAEAMRAAFEQADRELRELSRARASDGSIGTTLTFAVVRPAEAVVGHVGDSRAWVAHDGQLKQITADHSRVGRLLRSGVITEAEVIGHPEANVLDQALGAGRTPEPDVYRVGVGPGDILLLTTDGLHGALSREEMESALLGVTSMQQACDLLAALAQERGSTDNVTVLAWQYPMPSARTGTIPPISGSRRVRPSARAGAMASLRARLLGGGFAAGVAVGLVLRAMR